MPEPIKNKNIQNKETIPSITTKVEVEDIFEHEDNSQVEKTTTQVETKKNSPEKKFESEQKKEGEVDQMKQVPPPTTQSTLDNSNVIPEQKSIDLIKIENILSDHLDDLFLQMTPQEQMAFKKKGEETAERVNELLQETKLKIREILELIKEWLKIIPGVNKFFIEQEAKIKTDRLLNLKERK